MFPVIYFMLKKEKILSPFFPCCLPISQTDFNQTIERRFPITLNLAMNGSGNEKNQKYQWNINWNIQNGIHSFQCYVTLSMEWDDQMFSFTFFSFKKKREEMSIGNLNNKVDIEWKCNFIQVYRDKTQSPTKQQK